MSVMIQNRVDPKPQINENTENIKNLACSDPQLIIEIKTSHVQCFGITQLPSVHLQHVSAHPWNY